MSMNSILGEVFGTKTASAASEVQTDPADMNFFQKLCSDRNINVDDLNDDQVERLWNAAMEKKAADESIEKKAAAPPKGEDKEAQAKLAAARAELNEKRAAAAKVAEADTMGRIMAHSYVDEMRKIAAAMEDEKPSSSPKKDGDQKKDDGKEKESAAKRAEQLITQLESEKQASTAGSSTPNVDEIAAYRAVDLLKTAGIDEETAFNKVNAAFILGFKETTKVAASMTDEQALQVRALEICEAAGYPVTWNQA